MTMNQIMNKKGIKIDEDHSWNEMNHPAKNGQPRWGRIRKELRIYSPSDWREGIIYSIVGLEINTWEKTIEIQHIGGTMPYAKNLFWALLSDRDVRRLIKEYQEEGKRYLLYKVWSTEGMSGRKDIFMTFGEKKGGFAKTTTKKLCHISGNGRLNEGFGDKESKMYVGDFVELIAFMGLTKDMNVHSLRRMAGVKYIRPRFVEELHDFSTKVTKIL